MTVVVLGGGISGLAGAYYLRQGGVTSRIVVIEAANRLGGWVKSRRYEDGVVYEEGPRTLRTGGNVGANTLHLAEQLGLSSKIRHVVYGHPSTLNRMIKVKGTLHKLPNSLKTALSKKPPFTKPLAFAALGDLWKKRVINEDESLFSFVNRRFGFEVASYAIDPLARGVFAGNARDLSVKALAKRLHEVEQKHGSVIKGMVKDRKNSEKPDPTLMKSELVRKARKEKWAVWSLQGGLQTLTETLENKLLESGVEIKMGHSVLGLKKNNSGLIVQTSGEEIEATSVISCLPSMNLGPVLEPLNKDLKSLIQSIPYTTVGVVTMEFEGNLLREPAFGYLVPSSEPCRVLGVIFDTCTFDQGDRTILTVMMGGYWFKDWFGEDPSPSTLMEEALQEVRNSLNITESPCRYNTAILKNCIPQYIVGHSQAVENARRLIARLRLPLLLAGSSYDGVGINDSIMSAKRAAAAVVI